MASIPQRASSGLSHDSTHKIRGRTIVKPILKKLNSHSNSDRGSFDLDPLWDDQPSPLSGDYDSAYSDTTPALTPGAYDVASPGANHDAHRPRDVSFSTSASTEYPTWRSKNKYSHMRSTSGTSHTSSIATNDSHAASLLRQLDCLAGYFRPRLPRVCFHHHRARRHDLTHHGHLQHPRTSPHRLSHQVR
ncbi:hypothetical protein NLG97_g2561 [Lecanicillium saksenae]|uniref:Uncharacterized protein n=1 Tax=Lecanicillium saksenae TaxID=468837 RepID=A0ACC1R0M6_9HYPO|nr:hypothetical protein NLG97_g2561 [Lecanicillium saksenae]